MAQQRNKAKLRTTAQCRAVKAYVRATQFAGYSRKVARIRALLPGAGWSQNQLARRMRRDPALLSRALTGATLMPMLLDRALGVLTREVKRRRITGAA